MAEALQLGSCIGVQRVFGVGDGALADGIGGHTFGAGRCGDFGIDIGGILHKAGDAEKLGLGNVGIFAVCLQDGGIVHSVQRQHKAAVGIPQREGVVFCGFLVAVRAIQGHRQGHLGFVDGGQSHQHREQLFVPGSGFAVNLHRVLGVGFVAFGGAAPSHIQRFAVDQPLVAHAQLALLQIDHVDRIVGAVVAHQRLVAAVLVAAVVQQGGVGGAVFVIFKAQRLCARIIKDREHLPRAGVDFNTKSGIQKRAVIDILLYVGIQLALGRVFRRLCALVKVQCVDAGVQGIVLVLRHRFGKGLFDMPAVALRRYQRGEVVLLPCQLHLRRSKLRGLEHSAGV